MRGSVDACHLFFSRQRQTHSRAPALPKNSPSIEPWSRANLPATRIREGNPASSSFVGHRTSTVVGYTVKEAMMSENHAIYYCYYCGDEIVFRGRHVYHVHSGWDCWHARQAA